MTIGTASPARIIFACNGVTTVFSVNIQAYLAGDFEVIHTTAAGAEATLVLNSDYSMVASGSLAPPYWTMTTLAASAFPTGDTLQVFINLAQNQQTQYVQGQQFPSLALQTNIDRLTQMVQRLQDQISRTIIAPDGDVTPDVDLPSAATRASTNLGFDVNGNVALSVALLTGTLSAANIGAFLYPRSNAEIAAGVTPVNIFYPVGPVTDVRRYGYTPDFNGTTGTNNSPFLQNAVNVIKAQGGGKLLLPAGQALFTKCINLTNWYMTGGAPIPLILEGCGFEANNAYSASLQGTVLVFQTAADGTSQQGMCFDTTGSQNFTFRELNIYGTGTNASYVGILFARSAASGGGSFAQQHRLEKVSINMVTNSAVLSSFGSCAYINNCAEQFVMDHCATYADNPQVETYNNESGVASAFATINTATLSNTVKQYRQCTFQSTLNAAGRYWGLADSSWYDCVFARGAGSKSYALEFNDGTGGGYSHCQDLEMTAQIEQFPYTANFATSAGTAYRIKLRLFVPEAGTGAASIVLQGAYQLYQPEFDIIIPSAGSGQYVLSGGTGSQVYAGEIMLYPGWLGALAPGLPPARFGTRINFNGNGTGLEGIVAGTNMSGLASPNAPQTYVDSEGIVHLTGILQSNGNSTPITSGSTIGTVNAAHEPNRAITNLQTSLGGVGNVALSISAAGLISLGTTIANTGVQQVYLDGLTYRQTN